MPISAKPTPTPLKKSNSNPLFGINNQVYPSFGQRHTGQPVVSIDEEGNLRRCHFISNRHSAGGSHQTGEERELAR